MNITNDLSTYLPEYYTNYVTEKNEILFFNLSFLLPSDLRATQTGRRGENYRWKLKMKIETEHLQPFEQELDVIVKH
jgi:hypothetical protein